MNTLRWLLILLLGFPTVSLAVEDGLDVPVEADGTFLGPYLSFVRSVDPGETLTNLVQSQAFDAGIRQNRQIPNFGFFDHATYWARIALDNPSNDTREVYILNKYAPIDRLTLYVPTPDGGFQAQTMGDQEPFNERAIPYRFPVYAVKLPPGQTLLYFKMETSSAVQFNLSIWSPKKFLALQAEEDVMLGSIIGIGAVMFLYNLFVFLNFRSKSYLYYILYILGFTVFTCNFQGILQQALFPQASDHLLGGAGFFLVIDYCVLTAISFARSFLEMKERLPRFNRFLIGWQILTLINAINGLTFNVLAHPFTIFNNIFTAVFLLTAGLLLFRQFSPSRVYVLAWSFLLLGTAVSVLSSGGLITNNLYFNWSQPLGATCEFILLSLALTQRVALINKEKHQLQDAVLQTEQIRIAEREEHIRELDHLVTDRTRDIRAILQTINQGIFVIEVVGEKPVVQGEYSQHLKAMVHETALQGLDPLTHIFAKFNIDGDRLNQIKGFLDMALGSTLLSFELNSDRLVREATLTTDDGRCLSYEFDWSPMVSEHDVVEKILVTLRDVTQIRELRELSDRRDLEKNIIHELIGAQGRHFPALEKRGRELISSWNGTPESKRRTMAALHTLKGEARVCGLLQLAQAIHEAETNLQIPDAKADAFSNLQTSLNHYADVYFNKLGGTLHAVDEVRAPIQPIEQVLISYEKLVKNLPEALQNSFREIYARLNQVLGTELQAVLSRHLQHLREIGKDLNKSTPQIVFQGEPSLIPKVYHQGLQETFLHLLSNTMAHSLETKDERRRLGKNPAGTISIKQTKSQQDLIIEYRDDGRGLDLQKIREVAAQRDLAPNVEHLSPEQLADFIFRPGFSTQDRVTLTAGRGVGLDAVRQALQAMDGDIQIGLDGPSILHPGCYDFHFSIHLSPRAFSTN